MDIAILAGGYGTRLKGLWDGPKCLVPYRGRPVIEHIVDKALELNPRKIFLLLGHQASKVVAWREKYCETYRDVVPIIETEPKGTAAAIRNALPLIKAPVLILNGDTLPHYDLSAFISEFNDATGRTIATFDTHGTYAGSALFGAYGATTIWESSSKDLNTFVYGTTVRHVTVSGFLDVGTPEGFRKAQQSEMLE